VLRLLRSILNYSKASYKIPVENPVTILSALKKWHKEEPRKRTIKEDDFPAWYKAVDKYPTGDHGRDYLMLVLFTGLRKSEALSLEWEYVDFKNKTLTVLDTKNGLDHTLPLPTILFQLLSDRKARYGAGERFVFPGIGKKGHLFNSQHFVDEIKRRHGLQYTLHDIRRTFTTIASQLGYNVWMVNALTNHKSQDVTGKHYVHHAIENLRAPMEKIAREILKIAKQTNSGKVIQLVQKAA
jgi:integrase